MGTTEIIFAEKEENYFSAQKATSKVKYDE
jgi:hypothetical protein